MGSDAKGHALPATSGAPRQLLNQTPLPVRMTRGGGSIQGDLSAYALPDLLQFLNNLRKDGQLVIERPDPPQSASVTFVEGRLVHAYCPPLQGEECLQYILNWRSGRFVFLPEATSERETIRRDFRTVMLDAMRQHDELLEVLSALPCADTVFHRDRLQDRVMEITLGNLAWRVLERIDGVTSLGEIIEGCPRHQLPVARALGSLVALGLITAQPSYSYLRDIVMRAVVDAREATAADQELTAAVLSGCDGLRTLEDLREDLRCSESALIDAIELLYQELMVEVVHGHLEFDRYFTHW